METSGITRLLRQTVDEFERSDQMFATLRNPNRAEARRKVERLRWIVKDRCLRVRLDGTDVRLEKI